MAELVYQTPRRLLFIASIGNLQSPYRFTRHSAGHILLDAVIPLLPTRLGTSPSSYYQTWHSPSFMNESGPKLVKQLQNWMNKTSRSSPAAGGSSTPSLSTTLVILHDELESPLGKLRVRRGGPEKFSLRGHKGLISVMETLRKKGLYPGSSSSSSSGKSQTKPNKNTDTVSGSSPGGLLSILRVGVGIGRPASREQDSVADYVLTEMNQKELVAVRAAAERVVDLLAEEMYRDGPGEE